MDQVRLLTIADVARTLKVSKMTIYRYIKKKKLCAYKLDQEFRVNREDLQKFLEERKLNK
jgi:excisionase family DNA binding protein